MEADIARAKSQAASVERTVIRGAGAPHLLKIAKRVARKAKVRERRLERQMQRAEWIADPAKAPSFTLSLDGVSTRGRRVAALDGVSVDLGGRPVLEGVDLAVKGRERVAVVGENGAGKTTLMRLLAGVEEPDTGEVVPGHGLKIGYYAQEHETLDHDRTVLENMRTSASAAPADLTDTELRRILGAFLFSGDDVNKPAGVLSGGEKTRLALAMLVTSAANVLLLDEPTNNLDPMSRQQVLNALRTYAGAIVLVTHDEGAVAALQPEKVILLPDGIEDAWSEDLSDLIALA
jgi:ATP-binding cassette subfamily F protein 3